MAYVGALGGYSEARNISAASLVHLPKSFSYATGAVMMLKGLTAQYLLRRTFRVKKGHRVLVHAGAGGVGQLLCQWASALGAKVIATVGSQEKAEIAHHAGAKHVILYREEDFVQRVREITKGRLCDVVYDGVGARDLSRVAGLPRSIRHVRELWLGVGAGGGLRSRPSRAKGIALRHASLAFHSYRGPARLRGYDRGFGARY